MNWYNNKSTHNKDDGIWLTNTHLVRIFAAVLLYSFIVFMIGYFWGKHAVIEGFMTTVEDTFAHDAQLLSIHTLPEQVPVQLSKHEEVVVETAIVSESMTVAEVAVPTTTHRYYALLAGFSREQAAQKWYTTLQKQGIEVEIKKRISKSARGRQISWYQIVTKPFDNREELVTLVERIRRQEHLVGDIPIVVC